MKPNPGDVYYVKSTEEPVTFVAERQIKESELGGMFPEAYAGAGRVFVVRRPIVSDVNGIAYKFFDFLSEELETATEKAHRQLKDIKLRQELAMGEIQLSGLDELKDVKN